MNLNELAVACYLYGKFTNDDKAYREFLKTTNGYLNLKREDHIEALLIWLNKWGCLQFSKKYYQDASRQILQWYNYNKTNLSTTKKYLWELNDNELRNFVISLFDGLSELVASKRSNHGRMSEVRFGATGAAKILFAINPNIFAPWDKPIRDKQGHKGDGESYFNFLFEIKNLIEDLAKECNNNNFQISELPEQLNRQISSVPKLIDEYYWVTITRKCEPSEICDLCNKF